MTALALTAARAGLASCNTCGFLARPPVSRTPCVCPRCGTSLHVRKPASLVRTSVLLMAAYILYVPANLLPVFSTESFFVGQEQTIMSGVVYLWTDGSWLLAIIVFIASIVVPLAKLLALTLLVLSVQMKSEWDPLQRTRLFRLVEFVGRWSMLDIYVVAILTAVVQFRSLAIVTPGAGAIAFGAVVVLTLLAARAFDPRLIWDPVAARDG